MENVGYAALQVIPSLKGFDSSLERGTSGSLTKAGRTGGARFGDAAGKSAVTGMHNHLKSAAGFILGGLLGAEIIRKTGDLIGESIRGAIEDAASQNRAKLIFGPQTEQVNRFSDNAAKAFGLSDDAARSAAAGFGIFFKQANLSRKESAKNSIQMVKLAADLAAFAHTDPSQAFTALQRGLAGSTRGLKPFGVLIDSAQQKAEALRLGLLKPVKDQAKIHSAQVAVLRDQAAYNDAVTKNGKGSLEAQSAQAKLGSAQEALRKSVEGTVPPLTAQQKVLANQSLILRQTKTQQGQFSRSSGHLAQQQKILAASLDNAKDRLGKGLLPIVTTFVEFINRKGLPIIDDFSKWFEKDGANGLQHFAHEAKPLANSILPAVGTGLKDIGGFLKKAAGPAKSVFDAFNSLPSWAQKTVIIGGAAGIIAKKSGALSLGKSALTGGGSTSGGLLGLVSKSKPVPVFVVNEGFGGPGGGPGGGGKGTLGKLGTLGLGITAIGAVNAAGVSVLRKEYGDMFGSAIADALRLPDPRTQQLGQTFFKNIFKGSIHSFFGGGGPKSTGATSRFFDDPHLTGLHLTSTTTKVDAFNQRLKQASTGLDIVSRRGSQTFGGLTGKIDRASTRTDILEGKLRRFPKVIRTELDLDTRRAERNLATLRAHAGRHISAELSIELAGRSPQQTNLDGVRRH